MSISSTTQEKWSFSTSCQRTWGGRDPPVIISPQMSSVLDILEDYCLFRPYSEYFSPWVASFCYGFLKLTLPPHRVSSDRWRQWVRKLWLTSTTSEKLIFVRCAKSKTAEADRNVGFLNLSAPSNVLYSDDVNQLFPPYFAGLQEIELAAHISSFFPILCVECEPTNNTIVVLPQKNGW